jgi:hypothetical protein
MYMHKQGQLVCFYAYLSPLLLLLLLAPPPVW